MIRSSESARELEPQLAIVFLVSLADSGLIFGLSDARFLLVSGASCNRRSLLRRNAVLDTRYCGLQAQRLVCCMLNRTKMPLQKPYTKSHLGCVQCKAKRIKAGRIVDTNASLVHLFPGMIVRRKTARLQPLYKAAKNNANFPQQKDYFWRTRPFAQGFTQPKSLFRTVRGLRGDLITTIHA